MRSLLLKFVPVMVLMFATVLMVDAPSAEAAGKHHRWKHVETVKVNGYVVKAWKSTNTPMLRFCASRPDGKKINVLAKITRDYNKKGKKTVRGDRQYLGTKRACDRISSSKQRVTYVIYTGLASDKSGAVHYRQTFTGPQYVI